MPNNCLLQIHQMLTMIFIIFKSLLVRPNYERFMEEHQLNICKWTQMLRYIDECVLEDPTTQNC